jgi:hypothetical protein
MRKNIVLDDRLIKEVMRLSKPRPKREAVDLALREVDSAVWIDPNARQTPSFRAGKDSADAEGVLQCGVFRCSI